MMASIDEPASGEWNHGNRAFVQSFMARGTMTFKEGQVVLAAIINAEAFSRLRFVLPMSEPLWAWSMCYPALKALDWAFVPNYLYHVFQAFMAPGDDRDDVMSTSSSRDPTAFLVPLQKLTPPGRDNAVRSEDITMDEFKSYLAQASNALSPFDYEIRSTIHQQTKEPIYAFVNSTSDAFTQIATTRSAEDIAFIKRIFDLMFDKYNSPRAEAMAVSSLQALKVTRAPRQEVVSNPDEVQRTVADKGLTNTQGEQLLASLVSEGWLERSREGFYTLAPRGLIELRSWLQATYNDQDVEEGEWQRIKFCEACKNIVTIGQRCAELDCNLRLHDVCTAAFWRTRKERKCPRCDTEWDGKHYVGERAVTTTEAYKTGKRRSGATSRPISTSNVNDDDAESEDE